MEQQEYQSENIPICTITFNDNRPLLDTLLSRPLGLLALLDEESHFPKATDASLVEKFHCNIKSPYYIRPKGNCLNFTIAHYAGRVTYDAANFLEKNRYYVPLEIIQLHRQSALKLIKCLFGCPLTKTGHLYYSSQFDLSSDKCNGNDVNVTYNEFTPNNATGLVSQTKAQQTVATYFRVSLMELLQKLTNSHPHFVRCLKPNDMKQPMTLIKDKILEQLQVSLLD